MFYYFRVDDIVLNIDLAPTFLDMGGVEPPAHMDGRSLLPLLQPRRRRAAAAHWPDTFLVERSAWNLCLVFYGLFSHPIMLKAN